MTRDVIAVKIRHMKLHKPAPKYIIYSKKLSPTHDGDRHTYDDVYMLHMPYGKMHLQLICMYLDILQAIDTVSILVGFACLHKE